jgi:YidC/Oxa1 family membrane protein insertase
VDLGTLLYNIIIFPIVQIIDVFYLFVFRVFENPGIAVVGVSLMVSVCTLPLYLEAEKWQKRERDIQKRLASKISKIKAVFKGDEQYLILAAFYRQQHYHPVYALRSTLGLALQIPFFIAAYSYLSHLDTIMGVRFLGIANLGAPDGMFHFGNGNACNALPILMTAINIISGAIYTAGFPIKEKIKLYGMALLFLLLLYNSPSGIVLYWTCNNIFSLVKNYLQKTKHAKKIVYGAASFFALLFIIFLLFFHTGGLHKRLMLAFFAMLIWFTPFLSKKISALTRKCFNVFCVPCDTKVSNRGIFVSGAILFLLSGLVIPSSLIASSVGEFSFIEHYTSPMPFIIQTLQQGFGFFMFWLLSIYVMASKSAKYVMAMILSFCSCLVLINIYAFPLGSSWTGGGG